MVRHVLMMLSVVVLAWPAAACAQPTLPKSVTLGTNPPDCLATYAAAAIAQADFWKTGWTGMRLGIVAYVVPFIFVYHPALIFHGSLAEVVVAVLTASIGVILLGIGCAGYLFRPMGWGRRSWAIVAATLLIFPPQAVVPEIVLDVAGLALGLALVLFERAGARRAHASRPREPESGHPRSEAISRSPLP